MDKPDDIKQEILKEFDSEFVDIYPNGEESFEEFCREPEELRAWLSKAIDRIREDERRSIISKLNMIMLGIQTFKKSQQERDNEEKRGIIRRDGGPTFAAFSFIDRLNNEINLIVDSLTTK